jgi:hypothetical protein
MSGEGNRDELSVGNCSKKNRILQLCETNRRSVSGLEQ